MEQIKDGGPAFPIPGLQDDADFNGMTLRDYFAAKALQGYMANKGSPRLFHPDDDAEYAYAIANAMLRARDNRSAPEEANTDMLTALREVLKTPGLQSGLQAMCAAAVAKATGRDVTEVINSL